MLNRFHAAIGLALPAWQLGQDELQAHVDRIPLACQIRLDNFGLRIEALELDCLNTRMFTPQAIGQIRANTQPDHSQPQPALPVKQKTLHSSPSSTSSAARSSARALASVSSHSVSGTESATMPAAACT